MPWLYHMPWLYGVIAADESYRTRTGSAGLRVFGYG